MNGKDQNKPSPAPIAGDGLTDPSTPPQDYEARLIAEHGLTAEEARGLLHDFGEDMDLLAREARKLIGARRYP